MRGFGNFAMGGLHRAIRTVPVKHQADLVALMLENQRRVSGPKSPLFAGALYDVIWYGNVESKRLAIKETAVFRYADTILPTMDAAIEHPELMADAIESLG